MIFFHIEFQQKASAGFMGYTENCIYGLEQYGRKSELPDNIWRKPRINRNCESAHGVHGKALCEPGFTVN
jgi:hypothetical protein